MAALRLFGAEPGGNAEILGEWKGVMFRYPEPVALTMKLEELKGGEAEEQGLALRRQVAAKYGLSPDDARVTQLLANEPAGRGARAANPAVGDNVRGVIEFSMIPDAAGTVAVSPNLTGSFEVTGQYEPATRRLRLKGGAWIQPPGIQDGSLKLGLDLVLARDRDALGGIRGVWQPRVTDYAAFVRPTEVETRLWSPLRNVVARPGPVPNRAQPRLPRGGAATPTPPGAATDAAPEAAQIAAWAARLSIEYPELDLRHTFMETLHSLSINLFADDYFQQTFKTRVDALTPEQRNQIMLRFRGPAAEPLRAWDFLGRAFDYRGSQSFRETVVGVAAQRPIRQWKKWVEEQLANLRPDDIAWKSISTFATETKSFLRVLLPGEQRATAEAVNKARLRLAEPILQARAAALLARAPSVETAQALAEWEPAQIEILAWASKESKETLARKINARLDEMLAGLLAKVMQQLPTLGQGIGAVEQGNRWYADLTSRYAFAHQRPAYVAALAALQKRRPADLAAALTPMTARVKAGKDFPEVERTAYSFLSVPGDRQTEAGLQLLGQANERKAELDRLAYEARFSPLERRLMGGTGTTITVPREYDGPTAEEVRLAYLREIAALGGEMVDAQSARYTVPPLGMFNAFILVKIRGVTLSSTPTRAPDGGYLCRYKMEQSFKFDGVFEELMKKDLPQTAMVRGLLKLPELLPPQEVENRFVLTPSGWRSPSIRERGLDAIMRFYGRP